MALTSLLSISSTTTPALITASYGGTTSLPYGRPRSSLVLIRAIRAGTMTSVKFKVQGCRDIAAAVWVDLRGVRAGDSTGTVNTEHVLTTGSVSTFEDAIATTETRDWPFIRAVAKSVGADGAAGDSADAWVQA